jgi:hypothetical protein
MTARPKTGVAPHELLTGLQSQLQFDLQCTCVQQRPRRYTPYRDLRQWTPVDVRKRRTADS